MTWDFNNNELLYNKNINYKDLLKPYNESLNTFDKSMLKEFEDIKDFEKIEIKEGEASSIDVLGLLTKDKKKEKSSEEMITSLLEEMEDISEDLEEVPDVIIKKWIEELKNIKNMKRTEFEKLLKDLGITF